MPAYRERYKLKHTDILKMTENTDRIIVNIANGKHREINVKKIQKLCGTDLVEGNKEDFKMEMAASGNSCLLRIEGNCFRVDVNDIRIQNLPGFRIQQKGNIRNQKILHLPAVKNWRQLENDIQIMRLRFEMIWHKVKNGKKITIEDYKSVEQCVNTSTLADLRSRTDKPIMDMSPMIDDAVENTKENIRFVFETLPEGLDLHKYCYRHIAAVQLNYYDILLTRQKQFIHNQQTTLVAKLAEEAMEAELDRQDALETIFTTPAPAPKKEKRQLTQREIHIAETKAAQKAAKKQKEDYMKQIGTYKTPEQIKKDKEKRFKAECEAMRGSGGRR